MHLFPVRDAHPADQQAAAIFGLHGLRRVELKPAVQLVQRAVVEGAALGVEAACHPHRRIGIEKTLRFAGQPLRAADQQVGVRQRKRDPGTPTYSRRSPGRSRHVRRSRPPGATPADRWR